MFTRVEKTKSAVGSASPGRIHSEYIGDVTPVTANKMLTSLISINPFVNSIADAKDTAYTVDLLHDAEGSFVGLVLIPENARYSFEGKVVRLSDEGLRMQ